MTTTSICISTVTELQKQLTIDWHSSQPAITRNDLLGLVEANHMNNFLLWHREDDARRNDLGYKHVHDAKRDIDKYNQERNNCMERIDQFIHKLTPPPLPFIPVHTETPGMIIDRLSIIALKQYHTHEETIRPNADASHKQKCLHRLSVITQQLHDLQEGLQNFIDEVFSGKRTFRVYYQLKMYNDPSLNPQLYNNLKK